MRADRLISLMMLLQSRGRMTARELARELEVSERTIYRDVQALSITGIPVYGTGGPDGGFELVESYRTSLTGLSEGETRALLLLGVPDALIGLGVGHDVRTALLKLSASLPESRRQDEQRTRQRIHLAPSDAAPESASLSTLQIVYQAVWQDRRLWIRYQPGPVAPLERLVEPYALVLDADEWHLVYARQAGWRVLRVAELLEARLDAQQFTRRADFAPEAFWRAWRTEVRRQRAGFAVWVRIAPDAAPLLARRLNVHPGDEPLPEEIANSSDGIICQLLFESFDEARARLLGFGRAIEVLAPAALRRSIADVAEQVAAVYRERT